MNQNLMEMVFILDRSGSMSGKEADTIGGFNSLVEKQKAEPGDAVITVILFDDKYEVLYDRIHLKDIPEMTAKEYYVRGSTALMDAVGKTVNQIKAKQMAEEEDSRPGKTLFAIITDGYENSSKEYSRKAVKELIEARKKEGWEFLFIGANIDSAAEAESIGISVDRAANYTCDEAGSARMFSAVGSVMSKARSSKGRMDEAISSDWSKDI